MTPEQLREEHMRTWIILGGTVEALDHALHGRARFEIREAAYDTMAQARRQLLKVEKILWPDKS